MQPSMFSFPLLAAPPEVPKMAINVLTQAPRQHEIGHRVRQDRLSHYLDENFFTTRRQALFHLAFGTSLDLVLQILECSWCCSSNVRWHSQIFLTDWFIVDLQDILDMFSGTIFEHSFVNRINDLSAFSYCPDTLQYTFMASFTSSTFSPLALKNRRLSSANRRWLTIEADSATLMPLRFDEWFLDFKRHKRPFTANKKR